jgi:signal transduction histidine kinase/DNA-binding response OmpR family regulator
MSNSQGAYDKERQFLQDMQEVHKQSDLGPDALKSHFKSLIDEYETLLNEVRILIRQSDRQQYRINAANQDLKTKSEELELASHTAEAARLRAEASEKFKEQFLANMSHEIRTPMNAVLGMTRLLLKTTLDAQQQKYLDAILQSSENLLVIINDILDLSKIEAGRMEFESIPFRLPQVCQGMLDTLRFRVEEKGIELKLEMDPLMPEYLAGDPVRLSQVLLNLTGNAVKFTEKGGVTIRSQWTVNELGTQVMRVEVQDTGIGIPADRQQAVFESYSQAGADTSRKFGGTGLGLTISKHLVEQQGGRIGLFSTLGKGTTFWFELPYLHTTSADAYISGEESPEEIAIRLSGIRILLVEDNPFNQMVAVDTLKELISELKIEIAENGQEAVDYLLEHNVDIVLMDINMPIMDGFEATRLLRTREKNSSRHLPIMAMTAGVTRPEIDACMEAGMDDVIGKPFENADLLNKIFQLRIQYPSGIKASSMPKADDVLAGKRILIADDNAFNRMVAEDTLKGLLPDTFFEQAEDGAEILKMHSENPYHIILTDLNMPVMDGWEATLELRKVDSKVLILAMTAGNEQSERDRCRKLGMNGYISKPFDADTLIANLALLVFQPDSDIFV